MVPILTTTSTLPLIHHFFRAKHQGAPLHNSLAFLCVSHLRLAHPSVELRPRKRPAGTAFFVPLLLSFLRPTGRRKCANGKEQRAGPPVPKLQSARRSLKNRTRGGRAEQPNRKREHQNTEKKMKKGTLYTY